MRGRPRKPIDLQQVERLARLGLTSGEIAWAIGISDRTLQRRAKQALERGRFRLCVSLRYAQWRKARQGSVPMLIWLGKQYLGQTDRPASHPQLGPLQVVERIVPVAAPTE